MTGPYPPSRHYDVVIVGAGPVGLSAAIELGRRNVRCLLIERNDRVGYAPRAKTTNVRTRTHLRRWGIAERLAEQAPFGIDYLSTVHFVTRLGGLSIAQLPNAFNASPVRHPDYPEHAQWIPQYVLERVLQDHAASLGSVEMSFGTEFGGIIENGDQVDVTLRSAGGAAQTVSTKFLIGADGARSSVRSAIGAKMTGQHGLSRNYNIVFRAPGLSGAHPHGPGIMYWQVNADVPSVIGPMDRDHIWYFVPTNVGRDVKLTDREAAAMIARATGIHIDYEILSSDFWIASRLIADSYRKNRIFLIGDACHLHPPFGGYGMNMGIGDAVDVGWKIAAVLQGWGGPALLDSYEIERRPVHEWVMDEAVANHAILGNQLWQEGIDEPGPAGAAVRDVLAQRILQEKRREFYTLGAVLGYHYADSPVISDECGEMRRDAQNYRPSSRPGCLAPHLWLEDGRSLYDLFGDGLTLLTGRADAAPAIAEAARLGAPFTVVALPAESSERYPQPLTLVRPDQHVAWRGTTWQNGAIARALGKSDDRSAGAPATGSSPATRPVGKLASTGRNIA